MKLKKFVIIAIIFTAMSCLCIYFDKLSICVQNTLMMCCTNIIPALFPFFVLSDILIENLNCESLPGWIKRLYSKIFCLPSSTLPVFVSGLISGYPVGASLSYNKYNNGSISKKCAERLISFTNNPGPMFVISVVGTGMFSSLKTGIVLYIIHIISVFVTALFLRESYTENSEITTDDKSHISIAYIIENDFMKVIKICGFVTLFSILNNVISMIVGNKIGGFAACLTEITTGIHQISGMFPKSIAMPVASFSLAFSGVCVCLQVLSVTHYELNLNKYIRTKILNGAVASALCNIYMKISAPVTDNDISSSGMIIKCLMLCTYIMIIIYFMIRIRNKKNKGVTPFI